MKGILGFELLSPADFNVGAAEQGNPLDAYRRGSGMFIRLLYTPGRGEPPEYRESPDGIVHPLGKDDVHSAEYRNHVDDRFPRGEDRFTQIEPESPEN